MIIDYITIYISVHIIREIIIIINNILYYVNSNNITYYSGVYYIDIHKYLY